MFTGKLWAWRRDFLAIVKTGNYRHFQRVSGFEKRLFLICTRSQAFGQIAERNDEIARAIGLKTCGIFKRHNDHLVFAEFLAAIFHCGCPRAVIQHATLPVLLIHANSDAALFAYCTHAGYELSPYHIMSFLFDQLTFFS